MEKLTALTTLDVSGNQLTSIDVSNNTALTDLRAYKNKLTELDVSENAKLTVLTASENQLTSLDVSNNTKLIDLAVAGNQLTSLDVSNNTALTHLSFNDNLFTTKYVLLNEQLNFDNGLILPAGWTTSLYVDDTSSITLKENIINSLKTGKKTLKQRIYNSDKELLYYDYYINNYKYDHGYDIYVYKVTSDKYLIEDNNVYVDTTSNEEILNNINIDTGGVDGYSKSINNNKLIIKYNDKIIKEFDLVKLEVTSDKYDLSKDNIVYINNFDINKINVSNGVTKEIIDNKLIIKYKDSVIGSYNLLKINTEYKAGKNTIFTKGDSADVILTKITSDDVNLSITNDELIVKYNNEEIKRYTLSDIDESFDVKDYNVNDDKYIISGIKTGTKINDLTSKIDTNVSYDIIDISGNVMTNEILKTGYKIRLAFSVEPMEYVLSIKGDVLGTGTITTTGAKLIARHIIDGNVIKGNAYLDAADYNSDGVIKMNDVVRMLKENK